jgi:hypothetical protein
MVAATATPIANSVITVNAPLATDLSARSNVISRISAKKPAAAKVSHIGNVGERQISSTDAGQTQFIRNVPKAGTVAESAQQRTHPANVDAEFAPH